VLGSKFLEEVFFFLKLPSKRLTSKSEFGEGFLLREFRCVETFICISEVSQFVTHKIELICQSLELLLLLETLRVKLTFGFIKFIIGKFLITESLHMIADQVRLFINLLIIKLHEPLYFFLKRFDFFFILIGHLSFIILLSSLNLALFNEHFLLHFIDLLLFFDAHLFYNLSVFLSEHCLLTHYLLIAVFKLSH